ncbi:MAG: EF-hand domain-containing protein, partial [Deltaproteobacteria bacterium]|nr:EF-hand domain-containing protein [Deltaproteobacteria bacterium]
MPETNAEALRAEFNRFDSDGSGSIDEDEFAKLLAVLGVNF